MTSLPMFPQAVGRRLLPPNFGALSASSTVLAPIIAPAMLLVRALRIQRGCSKNVLFLQGSPWD